jgi:hypothetical protein
MFSWTVVMFSSGYADVIIHHNAIILGHPGNCWAAQAEGFDALFSKSVSEDSDC